MGVSFGYEPLCFDISCVNIKNFTHVPNTQRWATFQGGFNGSFCSANFSVFQAFWIVPHASLSTPDPTPLASEGSPHSHPHPHCMPFPPLGSSSVSGKPMHPSGISATFHKSLLDLPGRDICSPPLHLYSTLLTSLSGKKKSEKGVIYHLSYPTTFQEGYVLCCGRSWAWGGWTGKTGGSRCQISLLEQRNHCRKSWGWTCRSGRLTGGSWGGTCKEERPLMADKVW